MAPCQVSAPTLRKILDALFFRPRQQLVRRLKSPAAVGRVAVEGQVEFQAVWQQLDAALKSPVAVAERPEHGGGVSAQRHGVRGYGRGSGAWDQGMSGRGQHVSVGGRLDRSTAGEAHRFAPVSTPYIPRYTILHTFPPTSAVT